MTAGELIEALSRVHKDTPVVLSSDAEGNEFGKLLDVSFGMHAHTSPKSGELVGVLSEDELDSATGNIERCVVLWP